MIDIYLLDAEKIKEGFSRLAAVKENRLGAIETVDRFLVFS